LDSATLTSGTEQVVDFVLPLFAGAVLGLSAWETGLLVAASDLVAFLVRPMAGVVVEQQGWPSFFLMTVAAALPGLFMLWWLRREVQALDAHRTRTEVLPDLD